MRGAVASLLLLLPALAATSCDFLLPGGGAGEVPLFQAPEVELQQAALTDYPGVGELGAWYCPDLMGPGAALACDVLVGPPPPEDQLQFLFQVGINVSNPNPIPLPAVEVLVSLTLFPEVADSALGAICLGFCEDTDPDCSPEPLAGQCSSDEPELVTIEDFGAAAFGLLFAVVSEGGGVPPELRIRTIPAGESGSMYIALGVSVDAMLDLLYAVFADHWEDYVDAGDLVVRIPYRLEGTLWFVVEGLGKIPVSFGPLDGAWEI
ncbi:MAG: hypothetical protein FJ098_05700 [Deltaproteobacteria bacterium]|nr:hypothetical protein [Deltaproteobacteria bacterium]